MDESTYKVTKNTCNFCQTPIKNDNETFFCPSCSSPYHKDCWIENKGCAVYGCGEKLVSDDEFTSVREAIINIEYLINRNQFSEAIYESKQLLAIDRRNAELKNLYNKAVSLINNKMNLMTSADEAFGKKDYKAAEVYYKNVLKYADEVEANFVNTRLEVAKEKIPEQNRRRIYQNILIILIIIAIIGAIGYIGYYTFVLKEDREFSELVRSDNAADLESTEKMISNYETFLRSYPGGKNKEKALSRINQYSYEISKKYYKDDWRLALKYYNKIYSGIDSTEAKNLFNNIYNTAFKEYREKLDNAKKLNANKKYSEALNELNNGKLILSTFPENFISRENNILSENIEILKSKISSVIKYNNLEREIREQGKVLSNMSQEGGAESVILSLSIKKKVETDMYVALNNVKENLVALNTRQKYREGQELNIRCYSEGKISLFYKDEEQRFPLYTSADEVDAENGLISSSERDAINERLKNLKNQKSRIDSVLKLNLL
ncbi:MAG TPA: RING finger protein [Ignavibacteria bacterium]|nr:RING finger protein [Ignavibacteria bacterium]HMR39702.1 RING finger protein [Ignavibacteria bacterium]